MHTNSDAVINKRKSVCLFFDICHKLIKQNLLLNVNYKLLLTKLVILKVDNNFKGTYARRLDRRIAKTAKAFKVHYHRLKFRPFQKISETAFNTVQRNVFSVYLISQNMLDMALDDNLRVNLLQILTAGLLVMRKISLNSTKSVCFLRAF